MDDALNVEKIISSLLFEKSPFAGQENIVIVRKTGNKDPFRRGRIETIGALAALKHLQDTNPGHTVRMGFAIATPKFSGHGTDCLIFTVEEKLTP